MRGKFAMKGWRCHVVKDRRGRDYGKFAMKGWRCHDVKEKRDGY